MPLMAKRNPSGGCRVILSNGFTFNNEEGKFVDSLSVVNAWADKVGSKEKLLLYLTLSINFAKEIYLSGCQ